MTSIYTQSDLESLKKQVENDPTNVILINRLAIVYLEKNQYEESLEQFKKAVGVRRSVQSLNNLAWIYMNEGDIDPDGSILECVDKAIPLLEEAVGLNPNSDFPYRLLGEAYLREKRFKEAELVLRKAVAIRESSVALNNLGVALFYQDDFRWAANVFFQAKESGSEPATANYAISLIQIPDHAAACREVEKFIDTAKTGPFVDYVNALEVAEMFYALSDFEHAVDLYKTALTFYSKSSDWMANYVYALVQLTRKKEAANAIQEFLNEKVSEIKDAEEDSDWETEDERKDYIQRINAELIEFKERVRAIESGWVPMVTFEPSMEYGCHLFGCGRHRFPDYLEE